MTAQPTPRSAQTPLATLGIVALASLALLTAGACTPRGGDQTTPPPATTPATTPTPTPTQTTKDAPMTPKTPTSAAPATATPTTADQPAQVTAQHAIFGAGCFWGPELRFSKLPGVIDAEVGYTGGRTLNPTYKEVCNDETGHVEVVRVKFDPAKVTYTRLLEEFFAMHDPTQVNRQGPDFGTQYRTAVFTTTPDQADQAKAFVATLAASGKFSKPIATTIEPAPTFYRAEDYHQDYLKKRGIESCGTH